MTKFECDDRAENGSVMQTVDRADLAGVEGGIIDCSPWLTKLDQLLRWPWPISKDDHSI